MAKAFEDDMGNRSIMRMVWAGAVLIFMATWAIISAKSGSVEHFEVGDALFFASLLASKVGQKAVEAWRDKHESDKQGH